MSICQKDWPGLNPYVESPAEAAESIETESHETGMQKILFFI